MRHSAVNKIVSNIFVVSTRNNMNTLKIYRSLDSILKDLQDYKQDHNGAVANLLAVHKNAKDEFERDQANKPTKKHPLIILEGLDGSGKSSVSRKIAKKINAVPWCTPPESIKYIRQLFDDHPTLRPAYYGLGNYIAALEVSVLLKNQPVVMDRYWYSTCVYAMAQAVQDHPDQYSMPKIGDEFYTWPEDLLKPDKVIFLDVVEQVRISRLSRRTNWTNQEILLRDCSTFRENIIMGYKNMTNPKVTFVNGNYGFNRVLREIEDNLQDVL